MHCIFPIFIQLLILQNAVTKEITPLCKGHNGESTLEQQHVLYKDSMVVENTQRSVTDIWNNIKKSVKTAWNSVKKIVEKTKEKIATWVQQIKNRANAIKETLKEIFTELRNKIKSVAENVLGNENVRKCVNQNLEEFDHLLIEILNKVSSCISDKVSSTSALEVYHIETMQSDTEFMYKIEEKLNQCIQNEENVEECLWNVRIGIIKETEDVADKLLQQRLESRSLAEDILDAITTCSTDGLIEATAVISTEAINTVQCLVQHGEPESNVQVKNKSFNNTV